MSCPQYKGQERKAALIRAWIWSPCELIPGSSPDPAGDQTINLSPTLGFIVPIYKIIT